MSVCLSQVGLAVADIKAVQDQSAFKKMSMQVGDADQQPGDHR